MQNPIDHPIEQKKAMYLTSLLSETLPHSLLTEETFREFEIDRDDAFGIIHIYFSNHLKTIIESKNIEDVAGWKSTLHEKILELLNSDLTKSVCLLNMAPYTRTLIYSFKSHNIKALKSTIGDWFDSVSTYLNSEDLGTIQAFADPCVLQFMDIGKPYKRLRLLMSYRYMLGMNTLTFYDEMTFREDYSITEYKYLQRYETLLSMAPSSDLISLIDDIYTHIVDHNITDSKVIYIYKELISITIKHLYTKETTYLREINALNQVINNFEAIFDDAIAVTKYLKNTLNSLNHDGIVQTPDYHPHIRKSLQIISESYGQNIALSDVASTLKLSDAYLSRLFKEEMGVGFKDYLTKYRLNIIKDLLEHSSKSIIDIAHETGYNNPNQLTRIFKKYEQLTPSDYRHQLHN